MIPGGPAICTGEVFHRRSTPTTHQFHQAVSFVWLDPDRPDRLVDLHRWWSAERPAPARFRRSDYGDGTDRSLSTQVRADLVSLIGHQPSGAIRMLTQVRRWGWLFNPITLFLAWDDDRESPVGAVLEVTNTPWKQRHRYPLALKAAHRDGVPVLVSRVPKMLHVSPFLDEQFDYEITLRNAVPDDSTIHFAIDVISRLTNMPTLSTTLALTRRPATRASLGRAVRREFLPTHRVSAGIHGNALRLLLKRVPFVPHPSKRRPVS